MTVWQPLPLLLLLLLCALWAAPCKGGDIENVRTLDSDRVATDRRNDS